MKRHNPKYDNICWTRRGNCEGCTKKQECDATQIGWQKSKRNDGELTSGQKARQTYLLNKYGGLPPEE